MRKLTIEAISRETAHALYAALARFDSALLVDVNGTHSVAITCADGDGEAREAIAAIRQFVETQEN